MLAHPSILSSCHLVTGDEELSPPHAYCRVTLGTKSRLSSTGVLSAVMVSAALEIKRGVPFVCGHILGILGRDRLVAARGHPDFVAAACGSRQRVLQVGVGVVPACAVVVAADTWFT